MRRSTRSHGVAADDVGTLDALAVPFGTYGGVATCYPVPGATTLAHMVPDVLCALGKTEALTRRGRVGIDLAELWLRAHALRVLIVAGADGLGIEAWQDVCDLGDRVGFDVVFVCAEPSVWLARLPQALVPRRGAVFMGRAQGSPEVPPPVGTALPNAGFPALPAACARLLEPRHAARAQAIYDGCLLAAFEALEPDRLLGWPDAEHAFRSALARTPDLAAVALAIHAVRAAGLLRGYDIDVTTARGVHFDNLLTADRLDQLGRLLSPEEAAVGVLAGMGFDGWALRSVSDNGAWVSDRDNVHIVPARGQPLLRAGLLSGGDRTARACAPRRPVDPAQDALWATPPPAWVGVNCVPIDCRPFRYVGDPPMDWTRAPHARPRP